MFSVLLSFFRIYNNGIHYLFPEICYLDCKWWVYYPLNGFKFTGMVFCNNSSLMILVNDAKYINFYPTLQLPLCNPFTLQVKTIHEINQILLNLLQILIKSFVSNVIIELAYNLSQYIQYKHA